MAVWQNFWDWAIFFGSSVPALLWGGAITNMLRGVPIDEKMIYVGSFFDLLSTYTLIGGVAFLLVFLYHGALYPVLKIDFDLAGRARSVAMKIGIATAVACLALVIMTYSATDLYNNVWAGLSLWSAVAFSVISYLLTWQRRAGWAFFSSSLTILLTTIAFFAGLFPRLMVSSLNPAWSLTITNASSTTYTLTIMTMAAVVLVPIVLVYQGYTYGVFRKRVTTKALEY